MAIRVHEGPAAWYLLSMTPRARPLDLLADANPTLRPIWPSYPLRDLTDEERTRYAGLGYVKFEAYPATTDGGGTIGCFWTQARLDGDIHTLSFDCPFHEDCTAGRVEIPTALTEGPLGWGRSSTDLTLITITPSIRRGPRGGCEWHGLIQAGRFMHCGDSK
jgi:hypothetical protein